MNRPRGIFLLAVCALCLLFARGPAQETGPVKEPDKLPVTRDKDLGKDPTEVNPSFDFLLNKIGEIPAVNLRAKIISRNRPPMAILEIAGKEFLVSKNTIIEGPKYVLEVVDIQLGEVLIKWAPSKSGPKALILK